MSNSVTGYPFVGHVDQSARPTISDPKEFLKRAYVRFYTNNDNLIHYGAYKTGGYSYDFSAYLKHYVYKQYGSWYEAWAPNKTLLRQVIGGKIDKIVQI
jgi:hypothetical protein